jgi:hypothetical protein
MVLAASAANAEEKHASNVGAGTFTCAKFGEWYKENTQTENWFFDWAQGYMSGLNVASMLTGGMYHDLAALSTEQQRTYLRQYCDQHPLVDWRDTVTSLYNTFPISKIK